MGYGTDNKCQLNDYKKIVMPLFAFVILHYNTLDDTIECIKSITDNVEYPNYHIIVVENGSKNNSGIALQQQYSDHPNTTVLINKQNLGFAKGNNVGYEFAKYQLKADFIALINNDTLIYQQDFITRIVSKYKKGKFHILGPDIISTVDNSHQNPRDENLDSLESVRKLVKHYQKMLVLNYLFLDVLFVKIKKKFIPGSKLPRSTTSYSKQFEEELHNVKLHGSALVFSPDYVKGYDGLYPETFMYSEESILYYIVRRDNLTTVYEPEVKIFHKEDSATDSVFRNKIYKRRFYIKNFILSGKIFIQLMEKDQKNGRHE